MKISKAIFGVDNSYFLEFWPVQAKICKELLNIEPVLFYICDEDSDFYNDGIGLVKKIKKVKDLKTGNDVHTGLLACIVRMYGTKYFPNDVCLTCDLDMLMINRGYFIDQVKNFDDDSLVIYSSDAYDLKRPEALELFQREPFPFTQEMYNYPYNAAKGSVFNKILDLDCTFDEFVNRHNTYKDGYRFMWMIDEFYFADCVNNKNHGVEVHKLKRGYTSPWIADKRIDRHNFPVELEYENEREYQRKYGVYDETKLRNGYYIDANCCRPYSKYKTTIDNLIKIVFESNNKIKLENRTELCDIMDKDKRIDKDLIMISAYCDKPEKEDVLRNLVNQVKLHSDKFDLMVISHTVIPEDIAKKCDFAIYDKKNELLFDYNLRSKPWFAPAGGKPILSIFTGFFNTHLAIWRMIILGNSMAKNCGYKKVHHLEYDCSIKDFSEMIENSNLLDSYDSITYNKKEAHVDDILFGTYQAYRLDTLHEDLYILNEESLKIKISESDTKSPEGMLFDLLHNKRNGLVKNKTELDKNGNQFGLSHGDLNKSHTAWCLPYYDRETNKLCFIVWNMEGKKELSVRVIYNDGVIFNFNNVEPGHWRLTEIDDFDNAKKMIVILNDTIRNVFDFTKDSDAFKQNSFR